MLQDGLVNYVIEGVKKRIGIMDYEVLAKGITVKKVTMKYKKIGVSFTAEICKETFSDFIYNFLLDDDDKVVFSRSEFDVNYTDALEQLENEQKKLETIASAETFIQKIITHLYKVAEMDESRKLIKDDKIVQLIQKRKKKGA